jgi:hypothetical protein
MIKGGKCTVVIAALMVIASSSFVQAQLVGKGSKDLGHRRSENAILIPPTSLPHFFPSEYPGFERNSDVRDAHTRKSVAEPELPECDPRAVLSGRMKENEHVVQNRRMPKVGTSHGHVWLPDTVIVYSKDGTYMHRYLFNARGSMTAYCVDEISDGRWMQAYRISYSYDVQEKWTKSVYERRDGHAWRNCERSTTTFNESGAVLVVTTEQWSNEHWERSSGFVCTYDEGGRLIQRLEEWDANTPWIYRERMTYTYDERGRMKTRLNEMWSKNGWQNGCFTVVSYDEDRRQKTEVYAQAWDGNEWLSYQRCTSTYDSNGNEVVSVYDQLRGNIWEPRFQFSYTYDAIQQPLTWQIADWIDDHWEPYDRRSWEYDVRGNMLTEVYAYWEQERWKPVTRRTNTYDENGELVSQLDQGWRGSEWQSFARIMAQCDGHGNMIKKVSDVWEGAWVPDDTYFLLEDAAGNQYPWFLANKIEVRYKLLSPPGDEIPAACELAQNYPNPFNPSTTIRYSLSHSANVTLTVFNTLGQEVAQLVNEQQQAGFHDAVFRGDGLASGVYCYRLQAGEYTATRKLLLLK